MLCNLLVAYTALAQTTPEWCGTIPTQEQIDYLNQNKAARQAFSYDIQEREPLQIPILNHIVRESDESGGLTTTQLADAIQDLNDFYAAADMEFYECDSVQYINNSNWYDFDKSEETNVLSASYKSGVINIYYFNDVTNGDKDLCGYASFPPSVDRVMMKNSCTTNGTTLIHEIGHYFSVYHTHGKSNCDTTDELVDGSNCATAGDDVCDTDADPNLYFDCNTLLTNSSCAYIGTVTDANNQSYTPPVNNIMSYNLYPGCRTEFTQGQFDRARYSALNDRAYLTCSDYCIPSPVVPMNSNDIYIENVTLEQINSTSGNEGYADFTSTPAAELLPTGSYTLSLQKYDTPNNWAFYWYVWIDYNKNNEFETSELVVQVSNESSDNITQNFVVPADANGITRMRVYLKYSPGYSAPSPCEGAGSIGEIEDYTIMIGNECAPNYSLSGTVYPGLYKAEDYIESDGLVAAGDNVTFQAGNIVTLLPGFNAQADISSKFHALIQACTAGESEAAEVAYNDDIPFVRNFPNPFTGQTTIEFTVSKDTPVTLSVSDANGRKIATLLNNEAKTKGTHQLIFDGSNYPAGIYYYIIQIDEYVGTQKMVLVK